ncbi:hypothetical protein ACIBI9_32915 [Nonomuraea sp. NPDC050451]|uniref:hypothetical protein n=1 Tax=Nonomuraea sp. NPDC050451 TaxID=3364364 RepID=UPI00379BDE7C
MQRDFLSEAPYGVAGTSEVLPTPASLTAAFRAAGRPIVHIVRQGGRRARCRHTPLACRCIWCGVSGPGTTVRSRWRVSAASWCG